MHRNQNHGSKFAGQSEPGAAPTRGQQVMGLVDRKPVRPGGLDPEPGERRHQLRQKPRPLGDLDPQQVDHDVLLGITEKLETFTQPRWGFGVAQYDDTGEFSIVTLGVEHPTARRPVWQKLNRAAR